MRGQTAGSFGSEITEAGSTTAPDVIKTAATNAASITGKRAAHRALPALRIDEPLIGAMPPLPVLVLFAELVGIVRVICGNSFQPPTIQQMGTAKAPDDVLH